MAENDTLTAATMTPTGVSSVAVDTGTLRTQQMTMDGITVSGISVNPDDSNPHKLATSFALQQAAANLRQSLESVASAVGSIVTAPVLSQPLANPVFKDLVNWQFNGFIADNGHLLYVNTTYPGIGQGYFRLQPDAFLHPGDHYLDLIVSEIPDGAQLTIIDNGGVVVAVVDRPRRLRTTFNVDHPGTFYLEFRADNMPLATQIICTYAGVHYIRADFESYMEYMQEKIMSGDSEFVTENDLTFVANSLRKSLTEYIDAADAVLSEMMTTHITDTSSNPHQISPKMIGASPEGHTHSLGELGDMYNTIVAPLNSALELLTNVTKTLDVHLKATNPHGITTGSIGAATADHTHTIDGVVGLTIELQNIRDSIGTTFQNANNNLIETINAMGVRIDTLRNGLDVHEKKTGNIHGAVPADFGINFATDAEATDPTNTTKYMSPHATKVASSAWSSWKDFDPAKAKPMYIGKVQLTQASPTFTIPINVESVYRIGLSGSKQRGLRNMVLSTNGTKPANPIYTKVFHGAGEVGQSLTDGCLRFLPPTSSLTTAVGEWIFSPKNYTLRGTGIGYTLDAAYTATDNPANVQTTSSFMAPVELTDITQLTLTVSGMSETDVINVAIYEMVQADEFSLAMDANPAGTIVEFFGRKEKKDYSLFNGSILNRDQFGDLWTYAVSTGSVISKSKWDTKVASNGYCDYFHDGDGATTFGLPKRDTTGAINKYIKLKNTFLAAPAQMFFEYVWSE